MEAINKRRSIRTFKDIKVEKEKIEKLLRAAMQAPSAYNQQAWEFIVIEDKKSLKFDDRMTFIKDMFNLPQNILPYSVVSVGYPKGENKFIDRYDTNKVHYEKW